MNPGTEAETHRSRRRFLRGAGLGGIAVTIGSAAVPLSSVLSPAAAQVLDDREFAAFAESIELSMVDAYGLAIGKVTDPVAAAAVAAYTLHHEEHAHALGAAAGGSATARPNPKLSEMVRPELTLGFSQDAVVSTLLGLENAVAATYLTALETLQSAAARKLAASILPVEAAHAVVLGYVLELKPDDIFPVFETRDAALDPDEYPVAR